jgi:hypothetical protein
VFQWYGAADVVPPGLVIAVSGLQEALAFEGARPEVLLVAAAVPLLFAVEAFVVPGPVMMREFSLLPQDLQVASLQGRIP